MSKRGAQGAGSIRKKTITRGGKEYTYWEARVTTGRDPGTGKQVQHSYTGKTQKEVLEKLRTATQEVSTGTYTPPSRLTVGQWLDIWAADYIGHVKPSTAYIYRNNINRHIKPALGACPLQGLQPHTVQKFINGLELSPASVQLAYKVLYQAMKKAAELKYITENPAQSCALPRKEESEIHPLDDAQAAELLEQVRGTQLGALVQLALFTGVRLSEAIGLTWDCVDFKKHIILIDKQLARPEYRSGTPFMSTKNGKTRRISAAPFVFAVLQKQKARQAEAQLKAGPFWSNAYGLVFTNDTGAPLSHAAVDAAFSKAAPGVRFHDLRHTYAVNAIRAGDDIKTVQGNLGHATAAFTLDKYGHFTEQMKQASAARMESFIKDVLNL